MKNDVKNFGDEKSILILNIFEFLCVIIEKIFKTYRKKGIQKIFEPNEKLVSFFIDAVIIDYRFLTHLL